MSNHTILMSVLRKKTDSTSQEAITNITLNDTQKILKLKSYGFNFSRKDIIIHSSNIVQSERSTSQK